jgi:hypothetical protein
MRREHAPTFGIAHGVGPKTPKYRDRNNRRQFSHPDERYTTRRYRLEK